MTESMNHKTKNGHRLCKTKEIKESKNTKNTNAYILWLVCLFVCLT